jgi:hypothetical protein
MYNGIGRFWNEEVVAYSMYYPRIFLEALRNIMETIRVYVVPVET